MSTFSEWYIITQQWILRPDVQEYAVVVPMKYKELHGWADGFIWVDKQTDLMVI
jgi:hypothetical protein